ERYRTLYHTVVSYRDNVLMANGCLGQGLLTEARHKLRIVADEVRKNDLDRELGFQVSVPSLVNNTHAAMSQTRLNVILALKHGFARNGVHGGHPVIWTGRDIISETVFTKLALFHLFSKRVRTSLGKKRS